MLAESSTAKVFGFGRLYEPPRFVAGGSHRFVVVFKTLGALHETGAKILSLLRVGFTPVTL